MLSKKMFFNSLSLHASKLMDKVSFTDKNHKATVDAIFLTAYQNHLPQKGDASRTIFKCNQIIVSAVQKFSIPACRHIVYFSSKAISAAIGRVNSFHLLGHSVEKGASC